MYCFAFRLFICLSFAFFMLACKCQKTAAGSSMSPGRPCFFLCFFLFACDCQKRLLVPSLARKPSHTQKKVPQCDHYHEMCCFGFRLFVWFVFAFFLAAFSNSGPKSIITFGCLLAGRKLVDNGPKTGQNVDTHWEKTSDVAGSPFNLAGCRCLTCLCLQPSHEYTCN